MARINTEADFLRALNEHPEWRAAVRAQILGDELLQLPVQFQTFFSTKNSSTTGCRGSSTGRNSSTLVPRRAWIVRKGPWIADPS